ncbi:DUF6538 domain-containing protein [Sphingomonas sp.]|uniref:DUF6538 domain-containing protein n=1 Tax=Sphingomonas sp. TaxID=28214 RepID=UPI0035C7C527
MRLRVAGLWRHPRSRMYWFRMGVPERYRDRVGKREWKETLGTADMVEARALHARKLHEVQELMRTLDAAGAIAIDDQADKIVSDGFEALARKNVKAHDVAADYDLARGLDHVCFTMLQMMGFRARLDWGGSYASKAQDDMLGEPDDDVWPIEQPDATGAFPTFAHRVAVAMNIELFETNPLFKGAAFREVARAHLSARDWKAAEFETQIVGLEAGVVLKPKGPLFEAVAERILRRLAEHRFGHWPTGAQNVLQPMMTAMAAHLPAEQPVPVTVSAVGTPLSVVFKAWRAETKATLKTQDEFQASIDRFISVFGDMAVETITKATVLDFRRIMERLPYRPKKDVSSLPLREQVTLAAAEKMRIVSPETAAKNLQALRTALAHAENEMSLIDHNPADGVKVDRGDTFDDDRLPFSGEQLRTLFSRPVMVDATVDPDGALFWFMLLAPLTGCRCSELANLRPANVREEDGIWYIAIERDPKRQRIEEEAEGKTTKRAKTRTSLRNIPVHWLAVEAGFLRLVERQRAAGAEWLFDGLRVYEKYGDRAKNISRKLMAEIRAAGITDLEYVYHSFRHSLKGKLRDDPQTKEEISDLLTGHSFPVSVGRKYARGAGLKILSEAVERVDYTTVDWDRVVACGRKRPTA